MTNIACGRGNAPWGRDDKQFGLAKQLGQRSFIERDTGAAQAAEDLGQAGEVAVHLAGTVAGLPPIGLSVSGIEQYGVAGERCALW